MEKILIIGGCGFVGTRLYHFLIHKGFDVLSVDLEWFGRYTSLPNKVEDYKNLPVEFLAQFQTIILLAGHSSVKMCAENMSGSFNNNVVNFIGLLKKLNKSQRLIYASSSSIYGGLENELMSIPESFPKYRALNYYDLTKYEIDNYAKIHDGLEYYGLRFGTIGGFSLNFRSDIMINSMYRSAFESHEIKISNPFIHRPILGLRDLCFAVLTLIRDGEYAKRGVYNLASFNSQVIEIGKKVSELLNAPIMVCPDSPNIYDFTISTEKFTTNFGFSFNDSVQSIIEEIQRGHSQINFTNRNAPKHYE